MEDIEEATPARIVDGHWVPGLIGPITAENLSANAAGSCPWAFIIMGFSKAAGNSGSFNVLVFKRNNRTPLWDRVRDVNFTLHTMQLIFERLAE